MSQQKEPSPQPHILCACYGLSALYILHLSLTTILTLILSLEHRNTKYWWSLDLIQGFWDSKIYALFMSLKSQTPAEGWWVLECCHPALLLLLLSHFSCVRLCVTPQRAAHQPCPWDSPGKNTGVGCHFLLQCIKVKSKSEVTQSCATLSHPMDCSQPGSSIHGIFQARVLEWGAIAFLLQNVHVWDQTNASGLLTILLCWEIGLLLYFTFRSFSFWNSKAAKQS